MVLKSTAASSDECKLPFIDPAGHIFFFDVQSAEPGSFTVPGVVDLEIYDPGNITQSSWIFFKGDPMAGPQPGHPFEMPFDRYRTNFTVDVVSDADPDTVIRNIMPPTNSSLFWKGGAPFGEPSRYSMYIPLLNRSCKYYAIGQMIYRWTVPDDLASAEDLRLKLTTDEPASTHLSGLFRIAAAGAERSSQPQVSTDWPVGQDLTNGQTVACGVFGLLMLLFLAFWALLRAWRSSRRIALE